MGIQVDTGDELLSGCTSSQNLGVVSIVNIVLNAVDLSLVVLPGAAFVLPVPLVAEGRNAIVVAKVEVQNIQTSVKGVVAIVQSGGIAK